MVSSGTVMNSETVVCRNPPGTKSEDFYKWPAQNFDEMDSTLAVQQYIQQMIRNDFTNIEKILSVPVGQDEGVWKYEHLRQFCLELNNLAVRLQEECTPETCSQMTATEQWIFLCAAHKTPKECPAIDYTRHTLDGAACLLNSNKYFPSRVSIRESSVAKLGSVCRRVYRIFSHAYFHHRQIFDEAENESYLCRRFTVFVTYYNLMSHDNLIVPILNNPDEVNVSNNNSVIIASSPNSSVHEKHPKITIASFMDLPEGVVPDVEDAQPSLEDLLPDVADEDDSVEIDDGFTYTSEDQYGTMKPMKVSSLSEALDPGEVDVSADETLQNLDIEVGDADVELEENKQSPAPPEEDPIKVDEDVV